MLLKFRRVELHEAKKTHKKVVRAPDGEVFAICQKSTIWMIVQRLSKYLLHWYLARSFAISHRTPAQWMSSSPPAIEVPTGVF